MSTVRIQVRRGLASEWTSANPVLAPGEMGVETNTNLFKFGNGSATWTSLSYANNSDVAISEISQDAIDRALSVGPGLLKAYTDNTDTLSITIDDEVIATVDYVDVAINGLSNSLSDYLPISDRGTSGGVAALDLNSKIINSQIDFTNVDFDVTTTGNIEANSLVAYTLDSEVINSVDVINANDVNISGNLTITGTTTTVDTTNLSVTDPLIYIGENNQSAVLDLGIVASFNNGTYQHTGLVKDASDGGKWKLFSGVIEEPGTTVDFTSYSKDTLVLGELIADSASIGGIGQTEISYLSGVGSSIQDQLDSKISTADAEDEFAPKHNPTLTGTITLPGQSIVSGAIADNAIVESKINTNSISTGKIQDNAITTSKIDNASVITSKLAESAVTSSKIAGDSITESKIADDSVTEGKILDLSISSDKIQSNAVTSAKITADAVTEAKINNSAVTENKISDNAVTSSKIADAAVTNSKLAGSIEQSKVTGLVDAVAYLDDLATKNSPTFTGTVVLPSATSIGDISATEIGYLNGVTSSIQSQISSGETALSNHNLATENIHGIADTSLLATKSYADTAEADAITAAGTAADTKISTAVAALTKTSVGLANVDNTSDLNKPVSAATQTALDAKASLAGATFTGNVEVDGNLVVDGDFTVNGTNFNASATSITIEDNMLQLAHNQAGNTVDLGLVVAYNDGTYRHAGLVRDVSDAKWKLFKNVATDPTTTVDFASGSLDDLQLAALEATTVTPSSGIVFSDGTQTKLGVPSVTTFATAISSSATLAAGEADKFVPLTGAVTITLPASGYSTGQSIDFYQVSGTGAQFASTNSVVGTPGLKFRTTNSVVTAMKTSSGWLVFGDLSA